MRRFRDELIYGPVQARRLGLSLGINAMPEEDKLCPLNCVYCHCGWTQRLCRRVDLATPGLPAAREVLDALEHRLGVLRDEERLPKYLTFSGNGEAGLHPEFEKLVRGVNALRDRYAPAALTAILSNAVSLLAGQDQALNLLDRRFFKLDAGNNELFRAINQPEVRIGFDEITAALAATSCDYCLQTCLFTGMADNTTAEALSDYIRTVGVLHPRAILLYTACRYTADARVEPLEDERLEKLAQEIEQRSGIAAIPFFAKHREDNVHNRDRLAKLWR